MPVNLVSLATLQRVRLYAGQPGTSDATVYTVPASTSAKLTQLLLCNTSAAAAQVWVHVVASGGSAAASNRVVSGYPVDPNQTAIIDLSLFMDAGDFVSMRQGTASAITAMISGETYA